MRISDIGTPMVIKSSNIQAVVEKTSKQNTINFPEAKFLSQFLCYTVAHSWRYMCASYAHFLMGFCVIRLKSMFWVILLYLYEELDVSEVFLSSAVSLKDGVGHCFWGWGWLPCPAPPQAPAMLYPAYWEGDQEGTIPWKCSLRIPEDELSSQPDMVPYPSPSCPGSLEPVKEGVCTATVKLWPEFGSINLSP